MTQCTALRKMSLVLSSRKLRQPMIWLCHAIRFLSLVVSCACSVSLQFSSDRCLASSCISSRLWSFCMVWILSCNRSMVSSCVEISQRKSSISFFRAFDFPVAQPTTFRLASFFHVQSGAFLANSPIPVFTLPFLFICPFSIRCW